MALFTAFTVQDLTGWEDSDLQARVVAFAAWAEAKTREALGKADPDNEDSNDIYDDVVTDNVTSEVTRMTQAECLLALSRAIPLLSLRASEKGGLVLSVGLDNSRRELFSPDEARTTAGEIASLALSDLSAIRDARLLEDEEGPRPLWIC